MKPLCIDLCCGIGGWAYGFLAAGYRVIGFDIRTFKQGYPGDLVLQDIRTLDGRRFRNATVIVASPPCDQFALWQFPAWHRDKPWPTEGIDLFNQCARIGREAGISTVIENVRMAQRFLGPATWNFGAYFLWGDLPLLKPHMPFYKGARKHPGKPFHRAKHLRAKIPFDLAYWLAISYSPLRGNIPGVAL